MQSAAKPGARNVWETEGMIRRQWIPICLAAIIVVLFVPLWLVRMWDDAFASERAAIMNEGSGPADIRIAKGKLSGSFDNRPLFEVLDAIRSQAGFEYQGYKEALSHPVSGKFDGLPLIDSLRRILEPFNYIILFTAKGEIERLHILSFRGASAGTAAVGARVSPHATSLDDDFADAATELELDHLGEFEPVASETSPNDPDTDLQTLPEFEPVVSETGPNDPSAGLQGLPEFVPVVGETDPNDPGVRLQGLSELEPFVTETGSIDPNVAVEDLPEFE